MNIFLFKQDYTHILIGVWTEYPTIYIILLIGLYSYFDRIIAIRLIKQAYLNGIILIRLWTTACIISQELYIISANTLFIFTLYMNLYFANFIY